MQGQRQGSCAEVCGERFLPPSRENCLIGPCVQPQEQSTGTSRPCFASPRESERSCSLGRRAQGRGPASLSSAPGFGRVVEPLWPSRRASPGPSPRTKTVPSAAGGGPQPEPRKIPRVPVSAGLLSICVSANA